MRLLFILLLVLTPLRAMAAGVDDLARLLRIDDLAEALHQEGLQHGDALDAELLEGQGGDHWAAEVAAIYDRAQIALALRQALAENLSAEEIAAVVAFYDTPRGREIVSLELSARQALRDPDTESAAREVWEKLKRRGDMPEPVAEIARYIEVNDLIQLNVESAMSASYAFLTGLADGGALDLTQAERLDQVRGEAAATRAETEAWLFSYLLMAYRPLMPDDLRAYVGFCETPAGQALNRALFRGFGAIYPEISYRLGRRLAAEMLASDI